MRVALTPVTLLHQAEKCPEDLFFVLDVKQEYADDVIHALHIVHLVIIVTVRFEHIIQLIVASLMVLSPQVQIGHRPCNIFFNLAFSDRIVKL